MSGESTRAARESRAHLGSASGSAFGKVILAGEHAVVYGAPAIAVGIRRGAEATAARLPEGTPSTLTLGDRTLGADEPDALARSFAALLAVAPGPAVAVRAAAFVPPGGGLGCSAALGVAIARAVASLDGLGGDSDHVLALATAWEGVHHGNPSGIDTAAAYRGGCFSFTRARGVRPIHLGAPVHLAVGSTGVASSTRAMVEGLAERRRHKPELVDQAIVAITSLVDNAALALEAGDLPAVGKLLDLNQMLLAGLMLSTETIERLCAIARSHGALGAKLTGSGGGGSVIALVASADAGEGVVRAWAEAGFSGFTTLVEEAP